MKRFIIFIFLLCLVSLLAASFAHASAIIYFDNQKNGDQYKVANMLYNLTAHFDPIIKVQDVSTYKPGEMAKYNLIFYIGSVWNYPLPTAFLADVAKNTYRVFWIGCNLFELTNYLGGSGPFGFEWSGWNAGSGRDVIDYKGRHLTRAKDLSFYQIKVTGSPKVYSYISPAGRPDQTVPHFLCGGNLCHLTELPFYFVGYDERMNVLADLMHEFTRSSVPTRKLAMVRFEDLAPLANDPAILRELADEFSARGVPFSMAVTSVFKDPIGLYYPAGTTVRFRNDKPFVSALNYMRQRGGTLVMHGYTHQHDKGVTGDDWEFAYDITGKPLSYDSATWVRGRVTSALSEFSGQGWHPDIWETPHYEASHGDYTVFDDYFGDCWERPLIFPVAPGSAPIFKTFLTPGSMIIPYYIPISTLNMGILPETLGYIDPALPGSTSQDLLDIADEISIIRDGVASFYFHHMDVSIDDVLNVIDGLLDRGYTFVSPHYFIDQYSLTGLEDPDYYY